jgi:hypothetical protein
MDVVSKHVLSTSRGRGHVGPKFLSSVARWGEELFAGGVLPPFCQGAIKIRCLAGLGLEEVVGVDEPEDGFGVAAPVANGEGIVCPAMATAAWEGIRGAQLRCLAELAVLTLHL